MSSTDERVVNMRFNNSEFKKGAADTAKSLADVNKAVDAAGKTRGLLDLQSQMGAVGVTASNMAVVTTTALATIANKATNVALGLAKSLTFDPIKQGFLEYEELLTKQNVIQNATGKSAKVVKGYLSELNTFSDKTIYSFSNMTASITKFVNAGIPLPQAVKSIKGIANSAAFAGSTTEEANRAMVAFSQSMGTGFIMLNDWMQIENANMATIGFKEQLIKAGVAAGTLTKQGKEYITTSGKAVTATKGWREGLQEQWATTEVMNTALGAYTDKSTKLGREATKAATEVRTFTAFMSTLKESLGSGWSAIFTSLFGNLEQATEMWTGLSTSVGGAIGNFFDFIGVALKTWRQMGGFEKTLQGFKNILSPFGALLGAIGDAWSAAFPGSDSGAGKALYGLSVGFEAVTRPLQLLAKLISGSVPFLTLFFQVIKLGGTIIGRVAGLIGDFVGDLLGLGELKAPSSGGFLGFIKDIAAALGDAIGQIDNLLQKGASLKDAFGSVDVNLPSMPSMPNMPSLPSIGGGDEGVSQLDAMSSKVKELTGNVKDLNSESKDTGEKGLFNFGDMLSGVGEFLVSLKDGVKGILEKFNWNDAVAAFNVAIFATIGLSVARAINMVRGPFEAFLGIGKSFNQVVGQAGNALGSFQTQARAKMILNIAIALLLLAGALWILSKIPAKDLVKSLAALGATAIILSKSMTAMSASVTKMHGAGTGFKMIGLSIAILALSFAMIALATAFLIFNKVDPASVVKGLTVMFVAMKLIQSLGAMGKLAAKNMVAGAFAIVLVAGALMGLALALLMFKLVDWDSMLKAGVTLAAVALAVGLLALVPAAALAKVGAAMLATSAGMVLMATALLMFAHVEWESIGKAAVTLGLLAVALAVIMAAGGPVGAAVIVALAGSMILLAGAMLILNEVEWASIGKLALVFTVLSLALLAFTGIMYLMAPVIPVVALFGLALLALGLGMLAFAGAMAIAIALGAAGVAAFAALAVGAAVAVAVFLQTLAKEAPVMKEAFLEILQVLIDTIVEAVPMVIDGIKRLWEAIKAEFSGGAAKSGSAQSGDEIVNKFGQRIEAKIPLIVRVASRIIIAFLKGLRANARAIGAAGADLIAEFLIGIASKTDGIVRAALSLISALQRGIAQGLIDIVNEGIRLIAQFLHDLATAIRQGSQAIGGGLTDVADAFGDVGRDAIRGLIAGLDGMMGEALASINNIASNMISAAKDKFKLWSPSRVFMDIGKFIVKGLTLGIQNNAAAAIVAVASMVGGQIAIANEYINAFIQRLDQRSIEARSKAEGLAAAAERLSKSANKTKDKKDDKVANRLEKQAERAADKAEKAEKKAEQAKSAEDKKEEFEKASLIGKAEIRSQDAQNQLDAAKAAQSKAAALRTEANALDKAAKAEGLTEKQRKALRKEADRLRKQAKDEAAKANAMLEKARKSAADALKFQNLAGQELADAMQEQFDKEAQDAKDEEAWEKMSDAEKAKKRREEAAKLEKDAAEKLKQAKILAFTDIEAANEMAQEAMAMAELARQYLDEAVDLEASGGGGAAVDLQPTEAAALAYNNYSDLYDAAVAAASGESGPTFNQYNTSPEALSPHEVYRQTNNLLTHAASKINQIQTFQPAA